MTTQFGPSDNVSGENFFSRWIQKDVGILKFALCAIPCVAFSTALIVLALSILLVGTQFLADKIGYNFKPSDEMQKTIVAVTGAVTVAVVALYGVLCQTRSAEQRHMIDASQSLKKDILLEVAESYAMMYSYLMSFAQPSVTDESRQAMLKDLNKPFYKLQTVANLDAITAMLDANKAWALVIFELIKQKVIGPDAVAMDQLERVIKITTLAAPFLEKLWKFNVIGRKEMMTGFEDEHTYLSAMQEKYLEVPKSLEEFRSSL